MSLIGVPATLLLTVGALVLAVFFEVRARRARERSGASRPTLSAVERKAVGRRMRAGLSLITLSVALACGPGRTSDGRAALLWTAGELAAAGLGILACYLAHRAWRRSAE